MKNTRKLIAIATMAILTFASGAAVAFEKPARLHINPATSGDEQCNWVWYRGFHNYGDNGNSGGQRRYKFNIYTQTWLGSERSQYSCDMAPILMQWVEHHGKMVTSQNVEVGRFNSHVVRQRSFHRSESSNRRTNKGPHGCSISQAWWRIVGQSQSKPYYFWQKKGSGSC